MDASKRIVESQFNEANFGNFVISFEVDGQPKSIVNDRGELVLCDDLEGSRDCKTVVQSLADADESIVISALNL